VAADKEESGAVPDVICERSKLDVALSLAHAFAHSFSVWETFEALPIDAGAFPALSADELVIGAGGGSPVFESTAAAWDDAVFVWLTPLDAPGLAIRTETLTFVGEDCVALALGAALPAASLPTPADAIADASFA
jgi:hypothetical protein